ncbi:hypothetical protein [Thalassobellus citreus]
MTPEEALLKHAIRTMYANGLSQAKVDTIIKDSHNEVKIFFNLKV